MPRGGYRHGEQGATATDRKRRQRTRQRKLKAENIAILDMETDPFDNVSRERIFPFAACLYSEKFGTEQIWEEDFSKFVDRVIAALDNLPEPCVIYAHNGGKFDFMFLIHKLRGEVSFKGRGIMSAKIGKHELRDSFHIIPEKLAVYRKDAFDYNKMKKGKRNSHKEEIQTYLLHDCIYLFEIVKGFLAEFGFKISIGQAAFTRIRQAGYKFDRLTKHQDEFCRNFFFGGRVECISGKGIFEGNFKLLDVNSMYPYVMAKYTHPVGADLLIHDGKPGAHTAFVKLECDNYGAFVARGEDGSTRADFERGIFNVSIHEYKAALECNLIDNVNIIQCVDFDKFTNFSNFVVPLYDRRQLVKAELKTITEKDPRYPDLKKDDIFLKLLLNNGYGKFAQNPRRYKEHFLTGYNERPEDNGAEYFSELPVFENEELGYAIWERPAPESRYNNVATGASITGAARSVLMRAIAASVNPIYCDTDSLICDALPGFELHGTKLGAWDIEAELTKVVVAGKKLYGYVKANGEEKVKSKGTEGLKLKDLETLLFDEIITTVSKGPTLTRRATQAYVERDIRATGPAHKSLIYERVKLRG